MKPADEILRTLRALRWRMALGDFLRSAARAALFFFGVLVVFTAVAWWRDGFRPDLTAVPIALTWPFIFGVAAAMLITALKFPPQERVARALDAAGATRDRFVTALRLAEKSHADEFERTALAEIAAWARARKLGALLPLRLPRELPWIAAPVAMLALLWWSAMNANAIKDARAAQETAAISSTAKQLDRLGAAADILAQENDDKLLKLVADRLRQSAEQMRAEASEGKDAHKAALRELAQLDDFVKDLRRPEAATPDELKALADALAKHEQTREAAKDIAGGNLAEAAKKLAETAKDESSAEQVNATLKQALDHLAERREEVSKQIEKLQQAGEGGRRDLLKRIAEALNDLAQQGKNVARDGKGSPKSEQKKMTDDDLRRLLGALEGIKDQQQRQQEGDGPQGGQPQPGEQKEGEANGDGKVAMLNFPTGEKPGETPGESIHFPSGKPGNGTDRDTTKDPFGAKSAAPNDAARKEQNAGQLGEGESLSALIPSAAAGDEKAVRRYRELYDAAAFAAEDAVTQENIPLGARFLIRRYFQAIRPKQ